MVASALLLSGAFLASLVQAAAGQAAAFAQCGGSGYAGATTCVAGYSCKVQNEWYSQCVPSSDAPVSSAKSTSTLVTSVKPSSASSPATPSGTNGVQCTGTFTPISAANFVKALDPGWNLGNSLDATPDETSWNNGLVTAETFDDVKKQGFKSVRLPVTYAYHFAGPVNTGTSPDWTIEPEWLQRVSDLLDMITSRGLYAIVNVHHDSTGWADVTKPNANFTMIEEKFYRIWYQAGQKLACKSSLVAFETINEPPANTAEDGARVNTFNDIFLKAINDAGGFNGQRVVTLVGGGEDSVKTSLWFKRPSSVYKNPWAIQYHYYSPYDFVFGAWGKTIWGSEADKATIDADFANIRNNFTDVPLLIGEWDASPVNTESAARWKYWDYVVRTAAKYNTATVLWDNGNDNLNRKTRTWRDKTAVDILINAYKKIPNSLPDSTTDALATMQSTSAHAFHRIDEPYTDQTLPFQLNGNTFKSVKNGNSVLTSGTQYTTSDKALVLKASFLSTFNTGAGVKANLTVSFSAGADVTVQIVEWAPPTLTTATSKAVAGADLVVPIKYNGIHMPAAVRALKADGSILFEDWTQYLGPLQAGRTTFGNQWTWDWGQESVTLKAAAVDGVIASGQTATFMVEAFPRVPGNNVNYTLTV